MSFCQSREKARVFWKFPLADVVHLRHDGGNDTKDLDNFNLASRVENFSSKIKLIDGAH